MVLALAAPVPAADAEWAMYVNLNGWTVHQTFDTEQECAALAKPYAEATHVQAGCAFIRWHGYTRPARGAWRPVGVYETRDACGLAVAALARRRTISATSMRQTPWGPHTTTRILDIAGETRREPGP
jgi:hypothetical protein